MINKEVVNGQFVRSLSSFVATAKKARKAVSCLVRTVIEEELWRSFVAEMGAKK